jgi:glutamine amidotransferase
MKVAIIDIGMGNLTSVKNAFLTLGCETSLVSNPEDLATADRIVLPGVGAFGDAVCRLHSNGWIKVLNEEVRVRKTLFLGICLGMQVLGTTGKEYGEHAGLNWVSGTVERLSVEPPCRIPHIGWNDVTYPKKSAMYDLMGESGVFYFVHSYVLHPDDPSIITGICNYGESFAASIEADNIWATQYHPEKSQKSGLQVLKNFIHGGV